MSTELIMVSNHFILCCPLLLLPPISPSIRLVSNESALCISGPKYWSVTISPSNEYSGLISFRIDWFALLAVQGTQESSPAPQFESIHSSALSILYGPTLSLYMTTGKTIALTTQIFVGQVMSLLFNALSGFVIAFLPRSKHLLISWLQLPSAMICTMQFWNEVGRCSKNICWINREAIQGQGRIKGPEKKL